MLLSDPSAFDLDAYLSRIGYRGRRAATLDVLREIHRLHPQAIAFENLDPLLGRPVSLGTAAIQQKLVHDGRGGWCFEQNLLLAHALTALGFRVGGLAARVVYNAAAGALTPRGHMLLRIALDGRSLIADVGFGGLTMTGPLSLTADIEQATPHEPFRLIADGSDFMAEARIQDRWTPLYRFGLEPHHLVDYQVTNWYLSHHPISHFLSTLVVARPDHDRRWALRNDLLSTYHRDGRIERRTLAPDEIHRVLENEFRLRVPAGPELSSALLKVSTAASANS